MSYPNMLAGGSEDAGSTPFDLFAGTAEVTTEPVTVAEGEDLEQFQVVALNSAGKVVAYDPDATYIADDDTVAGGGVDLPLYASKPIGIMTQAIDATGGDTDGVIYRSGIFNHSALVWPAGVTTLLARRAAFAGTPISVAAPIAAPA